MERERGLMGLEGVVGDAHGAVLVENRGVGGE